VEEGKVSALSLFTATQRTENWYMYMWLRRKEKVNIYFTCPADKQMSQCINSSIFPHVTIFTSHSWFLGSLCRAACFNQTGHHQVPFAWCT
jgi:hypothetical protein